MFRVNTGVQFYLIAPDAAGRFHWMDRYTSLILFQKCLEFVLIFALHKCFEVL